MNTQLHNFLSIEQLTILDMNMKGEERSYFEKLVEELENTFETMPKTYEQDGKGEDAIVYLHYFIGDFDWYITERDTESEQLQAFGLACIFYDELGFISIVEIIQNGGELDFNWTPKTLAEVRDSR